MKSFTDDSLMGGEEAALSLRRLSGERIILVGGLFPRRGGLFSVEKRQYMVAHGSE